MPATSARPLKLTPSMLTFLWDDCPRCFWLKARHGIDRPRMLFPSVFSKYHTALQHYFIGRSPSELSDELPSGVCLAVEAWVKSAPMQVAGCSTPFYIVGRLDHLTRFDDGSWGVIDYKTTDQRAGNVEKYTRQLHAYAWALERAARNAFHRTPVSRLGLFCLDPARLVDYHRGERATFDLVPHWIEVPRDDAAFEAFLGEAVQLAARPEPPAAGAECSVCKYTDQRAQLETEFVSDDLPF